MKKQSLFLQALLALGASLMMLACQQNTVDPTPAADDLTSLVTAARGIAGGDSSKAGHGNRPRLTEVATADLPAAVLSYVTANYAGATLEKAARDDAGNFAVLIKKADGTMTGLIFDASGNFKQEMTKGGHGGKDGGKGGADGPWHHDHGTSLTAVGVASLPGPVSSYVSTNYAGSTIEKAGKDARGNYLVSVKQADGRKVQLLFDASGTFTKVLSRPGGPHGDLTKINASALPANASAYIVSTYAGSTIEMAATDANGNYITTIRKADGTRTVLVFDATGAFKEELKPKHRR